MAVPEPGFKGRGSPHSAWKMGKGTLSQVGRLWGERYSQRGTWRWHPSLYVARTPESLLLLGKERHGARADKALGVTEGTPAGAEPLLTVGPCFLGRSPWSGGELTVSSGFCSSRELAEDWYKGAS